MAISDQILLSDFVQRSDEAAFRALTKRYLGLIFHTAYRRTHNHALSQDISQGVLLALSKKAPILLRKNQDLAPWLHRATLYESSKAMRSEQSQQQRKDRFSHETETEETSASKTWKEALPHLDEALNHLPESDRRVLILHFFEEKTFPNIAETVGKSPAAAQKQSRRALEKLAQILQRKGVVISSLAIGSSLSSELAKAAPPSVAKALSSIALSASQPFPVLGTILGATGLKILLLVSASTLVAFWGVRQAEIAKKKNQNEQLKAEFAQAPLKSKRKLQKANASGAGRFRPDAALLAASYYEANLAQNQFEELALKDYLKSLDEETLAELLTQSATALLPRKHQKHFISALVNTLSVKNAERAVRTVFEAHKHDQSQDFRKEAIRAFSHWLLTDLLKSSKASIEWLQEQENASVRNRQSDRVLNPFREEVLNVFLQNGYDQASSYLQEFSEENQGELLSSLFNSPYRGCRETDAEHFLKLSSSFNDTNRHRVIQSLASRRDSMPPLQWIDELHQSPHLLEADRDHLLIEGAKTILRSQSVAVEKVEELHHWLEKKDPSSSNQIIAEAFVSIPKLEKGFQLASSYSQQSANHEWIASYLSHEPLLPLLQKEARQEEVLSLVERIPDPDLRSRIHQYLSLEN